MKQKCWFYHNFNIKIGFKIQRFGGKIASLPINRTIVLVYRCQDCQQKQEEYHSRVPSHLAEDIVKSLNIEYNLKSNC